MLPIMKYKRCTGEFWIIIALLPVTYKTDKTFLWRNNSVSSIIKKLKLLYLNENFPFLLLFLYICLLHIFMIICGDDLSFQSSLNNQSFKSFLIFRYDNWTSRLIIEGAMVLLLKVGFLLWKVLDIIIYMLLAYSISELFNKNKTKDWDILLVFLIVLYPIKDMSTAGWTATSMNYIWPLSLGLYSLISIKKVISNNKIHIIHYFLYVAALIYASNAELNIIWLVPTFAVAFFYNIIKNKKVSILLCLELFISIINLYFFIKCPGNANRLNLETQTWMPDFETLSFWEKCYLGISETIVYFVNNNNSIFLLFSVILCYGVFTKYNKNLYRLISMIPVICCLVSLFSKTFPIIYLAYEKLFIEYNMEMSSYNGLWKAFHLFLYFILIGSIIISIILILEKNYLTLTSLFILAAGFASRVALGFSPTLYASGTRTYLLLYFSFIIIILFIVNSGKIIFSEKARWLLYRLIGVLACFSIINNFIASFGVGRL